MGTSDEEGATEAEGAPGGGTVVSLTWTGAMDEPGSDEGPEAERGMSFPDESGGAILTGFMGRRPEPTE